MTPPTPVLDREEYVEQAYFFRAYRERLEDNLPAQEILETIADELLATTKLVHAVDFLRGEILLNGLVSDGMRRLTHYFTPLQAFVMARAEDDASKFDQPVALQILERMAEYMADDPSPRGLFVYQFECLARNRLGYDAGMAAMAADGFYDADWRDWIMKSRLRLGTLDFAEMIYLRSAFHVEEARRRTGDPTLQPEYAVLFGSQDGRIAKANTGRDPLYMFAALQRHLGFPSVPRQRRSDKNAPLHPLLEGRLQRLEQRLKLLESEVKEGGVDLSQFYAKPPKLPPDDPV
jgi:hypothetical protein